MHVPAYEVGAISHLINKNEEKIKLFLIKIVLSCTGINAECCKQKHYQGMK